MPHPPVPPRIHVLLARNAPVAVVIRRGPSKHVVAVRWDRRHDSFRLGQWFKGRIYERRSDISPDGRYAIYFAMNGKWNSESRGSWTAISRVPYLKAIVFLPKGDCWHGGGLWTGESTYWLNDGYGHTIARDTDEVRRDTQYRPTENYGGECPGVYFHRLLRDGWKRGDQSNNEDVGIMPTFEKSLGKGWVLRKIAHAEAPAPIGKSCCWDEHELVGPGNKEIVRCPDWEWADLDGERLVWAAHGKLCAAAIHRDGLVDEVLLKDFNDMVFQEIEAPY